MSDNPTAAPAARPRYKISEFSKADSVGLNVIVSNAFEMEDQFKDFYGSQSGNVQLLEPPYSPRKLIMLCERNNTLPPCIEAMVTNCDGTGYVFERRDMKTEGSEDDSKIKELENFFEQVWPGVSFTALRKELRRDQEQTGNAYMEVIRNPQDDVIFLRRVPATMMRIVKLDEPVVATKTIRRGDSEVSVKMEVRERRFAQMVGTELVFFKEFGASRDLDKKTGKWADVGSRLPHIVRASEIIHFTKVPSATTPYGVPVWISQIPSVLGSRNAEELNLDFFDNGGLPPIMLLLTGGVLTEETRRALEQAMSGGAKQAARIKVIEMDPTGGTIDKEGSTRLTVERFGAERQNDSMFEGYDTKCEVRIRRSWRLPPIFVGAAADYAFATAFVSYTVAEAQVFKPERDEFDEVITSLLLPAMKYPGYVLRSLPMTIKDVDKQLEGLRIAAETNHVEPEDLIEAVNEAVDLSLKVTDEPVVTMPFPQGQSGASSSASQVPSRDPTRRPSSPITKTADHIVALALDSVLAMRKRDVVELKKNMQLVSGLSGADQAAYQQAVAACQFLDPGIDPIGLAELSGCTLAVMSANLTEAA